MWVLGIDIGSSSVRAAMLREGRIVGRVARIEFNTRYKDARAEVDAQEILGASAKAVRQLPSARRAEVINIGAMAPSWVAMDRRGRALTPIVTHQDRRSVEEAKAIEAKVGKGRHLRLAGNRPFPGGISSTTWAWFLKHHPSVLRRADLVGHLTTFLHMHLTGARVIDPSNASFMGVYSTLDLSGWSEELMEVVGAREHQLPQLMEADAVAGFVTHPAAAEFGLTHGTPVLVGIMDGSAAMLAAAARVGQLLHMAGSTDVLALCTDRPRPHERLLTRALGIGRKWLSVATIAAGGSSLEWARREWFADLPQRRFWKLVENLARHPLKSPLRFEPYLAGDRMSIEQKQAALRGLTLSSTRQEMLSAVIEALAQASAQRLALLRPSGTRILPTVVVSGGAGSMRAVMQRDWPGDRRFRTIEEASLRGLMSAMQKSTSPAA